MVVAQASTTMLLFLGHRAKATWDNEKIPKAIRVLQKKWKVVEVLHAGFELLCRDHNSSIVVNIYIDFPSGQGLDSFSWIFYRIAPTAEIVFGIMIMILGDTKSIISC